MPKRRSRPRGGWRRKGNKLQAYVRLFAGKGGLRTRAYPLDAKPTDIQEWIDTTAQRYRRKHPQGASGTLAGDVPGYLKLLVDRPRLQNERRIYLAWWCDRFGKRSRWTLTSVELETALNELLASGAAASTVKHHRTALFHLFTKLDGKDAPNPLRDVPPPRQPDPLPRWIPPQVIDWIFHATPTRRYQRKLTGEQTEEIRRRARLPKANGLAIAKDFGVSETTVRHIARGKVNDDHDALAQMRARNLVVARTGLPPAVLMAIELADIDLDGASVLTKGRRKGGGAKPVRLPLTPAGVEAFRELIAAKALGPYNTTTACRIFQRGVERMCARLEADPSTEALGAKLREELADATPYWLRHSFLTEVQLATGNIKATQGLAIHADSRQTDRYTLAAVAPELRAAVDALAARMRGQRPGNQTSDRTNSFRDFVKDPETRKSARARTKKLAKAKKNT